MSVLVVLLVIWGVITAALILLVIYRSVVSMHEDDQLFLSRGEAHMEAEQREVIARLNRTEPYVKYLGVASGILLALIVGVWMYQGLIAKR